MATAHPDDLNPYRAPIAPILAPTLAGSTSDSELIRRTYLSYEASVRSLGSILYLFACIGVLALIFIFFNAIAAFQQPALANDAAIGTGTLILINFGSNLVQTSLYIALGYGLRGLKAWARWVTLVLSFLGLFGLVVGGVSISMMINGPPLGVAAIFSVPALIVSYIISMMVSSKATMVFSSEYREVIRQTPYVKYKTSLLVKIILVLILGLILIGIVSSFLGSS